MTMASVSVAGPQQQQPGPQRARTQEPLLIFGVKKTLLPRKTSWEKMVFRRSSVSDKPAQTAPAAAAAAPGLHGGVTPAEGARTRQDIPGGVLDLSMKRTVTANGHVSTSTGADCRTSSPQNVSMNGRADCGGAGDVSGGPGDVSGGPGDVFGGPGDVSGAPGDVFGSSLPSLERLTRGKTGVVKLARAETHRREAWAIFPAEVTVVEDPRVKTGQGHMSEDPRVKTETGQGHRFEARAVREDWCDACSRQVHTRALKCHNCSYTCHLECESHVQLDCNQGDRKHERTPPPRILCSTPPQPKVETKEDEDRGTKELTEEEARQRIQEYNSHVSENGMKLSSDGSYNGFIRVHLRLSRPVTVKAVDSPAPDGQVTNQNARLCSDGGAEEESTCSGAEKRTSFYLPCDCVKQVHISSLTSTREVIQGLLKMFTVLDNPCKFALYRQTHRDGQDLFQKLPLWERPLLLRLIAGPDTDTLSFVLKENDTGEVEWHAFSVPELQNFLGILEKEESERVRAVELKFAVYRRKLQEALQRHDPQ